MRAKELVICGLKAVRSRFETNSNSIRRLFFNRATAPAAGDLCRWMAQERMVYRCVESDELELISGSVHHGGIVVVVDAPQLRAPELSEIQQWAAAGETLLLLDRVGNVHNLGAIIRSAAFFGVTKLILPDDPLTAFPTEATYRVAEGGLDHVHIFSVTHLVPFIRALQPNYSVIGAATRGGRPELAARDHRPVALVLGNEEQGLAPDVSAACDAIVTIPGSNRIESLNVSAAAAVMLWEFTQRRHAATPSNNSSRGPNQPRR